MIIRRLTLLAVFLFSLTQVNLLFASTTVTVIDRGLNNMVKTTVTLPTGWTLLHNIETNTTTAGYNYFQQDINGPSGELIREIPMIRFSPFVTGYSFEQTWQAIVQQYLQDVMTIQSIGQLRSDGELLRSIKAFSIQKYKRDLLSGQELYEVTVSGLKNNKPHQSKIWFLVQRYDPQSGHILSGIFASPSNLMSKTIKMAFEIEMKAKVNPQYDGARARVIDQVTRQNTASHKQRMQANQQSFNQHQQMMQQQSQINDQQNQQWMNNFSQPSNSNYNNTYSGQDATIDSIHDSNTFADPDSGQNRTFDGQYQYNYTDGQGNYYGTDDPSFNTNSLPSGNWQQIDPLAPQY